MEHAGSEARRFRAPSHSPDNTDHDNHAIHNQIGGSGLSPAMIQVATWETVFSTLALSLLSRVRDNKDYPEDLVIPNRERDRLATATVGADSSG